MKSNHKLKICILMVLMLTMLSDNVISKDSDDVLRKAVKELPSEMDEAAKARFVKGVEEFASGVKAVEWEDVVTKGTKDFDKIPLSEGGKYIKANPGNPSSTASEIISFENFYKRGMTFLKGENGVKAIQYQSGFNSKPVEFIGKMGDEKVAVQTTRVFNPDKLLTVDEAKRILEDGLNGLNKGLTNVVAADKWDKGVVHAIIKDSDKDIVESAIKILNTETVGNNRIVITIAEDTKYIWGGK